MLLDDNLVFFDGVALTDESTSDPVPLNALFRPGRYHDAIPMVVMLTEAPEGGTGITLKLQQADESKGAYGDVPGASMTILLADMVQGENIGWRSLPAGVTKPWMRMVVTPDGSFTAGKLFAAITREEMQPYGEGLYINAGETIG